MRKLSCIVFLPSTGACKIIIILLLFIVPLAEFSLRLRSFNGGATARFVFENISQISDVRDNTSLELKEPPRLRTTVKADAEEGGGGPED